MANAAPALVLVSIISKVSLQGRANVRNTAPDDGFLLGPVLFDGRPVHLVAAVGAGADPDGALGAVVGILVACSSFVFEDVHCVAVESRLTWMNDRFSEGQGS